jgi:hypothetical protein
LALHFSEFSVIFYAIYKISQLTFPIGDALLQLGPWQELLLRNVAPGRGWPARLPNSGEGSMGRYGLVWALGWWGDVAGGRCTGGQGVPAAAAGQASEGDLGRWLKLAGELLGSLRRRWGRPSGQQVEWKRSSSRRRAWRLGGMALAPVGAAAPFIAGPGGLRGSAPAP